MKIGLVCPYNIFKGGGVQECVMALENELTDRGHQVVIITPRPIRNGRKELADVDVLFVGTAVNVNSPFQATTAQGSIKVDPRELASILKDHEFDILHFHEPEVPFLSRQIISKSTSAHIGTFHAKLPNTFMGKSVEKVITPYTKSILRSLHIITAVSDAASEYISSVSTRKPAIIPNGVDLNKYKPAKTKKHKKNKIVSYVGRLERRKGLRYLLQAFAELSESNAGVILKIAGDGPDRNKLKSFVEDKGIKNVEFLGHISEQEKIDLLNQSDVFCSPAIFGESFGIVLLEAMATGTVVVAGNNPGYSSVMKERGALSLVNPKDTQEFARRLELMIFDVGLRESWLAWATEYVQQFSYKKVVDEYEKTYHEALKKHRL